MGKILLIFILSVPFYTQAQWEFAGYQNPPGVSGLTQGTIYPVIMPGLSFNTAGHPFFSMAPGPYSFHIPDHLGLKFFVHYFNGNQWIRSDYIDHDTFSYSTFFRAAQVSVGKNNIPVVAYLYNDSLHCFVGAKKLIGNTWMNVGPQMFIDSVHWGWGEGESLRIAQDAGDTIYISYVSPNSRLCVVKFNGTNWTSVGQKNFAKPIYSASTQLVLGKNNLPYILTDSGIAKFDGIKWNILGFTPYRIFAFTLDTLDTPYAIIQTDTTPQHNRASVAKLTQNGWSYIGNSNFFRSGSYYNQPSIVVSSSGTPYVAFKDSAVYFSVLHYNGNSWVNTGNITDSMLGSNIGYGFGIQLKFNQNQQLHCLYKIDSSEINVIRYNPGTGSWDLSNGTPFTPYPNPVSDRLNIVPPSKEKWKLTVIDCTGKIVDEVTVDAAHAQIETNNWPKGLLFCRLQQADRVLTYRIIKQ